MRKSVTTDQSHAIIQALATNTDWSVLDGDLLQKIVVANAKWAGAQFTRFLLEGCKLVIGMLKALVTIPFNPAEFLGEGWGVWRGPVDGDGLKGDEDVDPRAQTMTELEVSRIAFNNALKKGETSITGEEFLRRLKKKGDIRLGANAFLALWRDYEAKGKESIIEALYQTNQCQYIYFFGTILRKPDGHRYVLYLYRDGNGEWNWDCDWLDDDWDVAYFSVGCASPQNLDP